MVSSSRMEMRSSSCFWALPILAYLKLFSRKVWMHSVGTCQLRRVGWMSQVTLKGRPVMFFCSSV